MVKRHTRKKRRTYKRRRGGDEPKLIPVGPNRWNVFKPNTPEPQKAIRVKTLNPKNFKSGSITIKAPMGTLRRTEKTKPRFNITNSEPKTAKKFKPNEVAPPTHLQPLSISKPSNLPPIFVSEVSNRNLLTKKVAQRFNGKGKPIVRQNEDPASARGSMVSTASNGNDPASRRSSTVSSNGVRNEPGSQRSSIAPGNVNDIQRRTNLWG